jgi:hypothetical protein
LAYKSYAALHALQALAAPGALESRSEQSPYVAIKSPKNTTSHITTTPPVLREYRQNSQTPTTTTSVGCIIFPFGSFFDAEFYPHRQILPNFAMNSCSGLTFSYPG